MKLMLLILALSLCAAAQTSSNVSGVTLTGPANDPKIENHAAKEVLVVMMEYVSPVIGTFGGNTWFIYDSHGLTDGDSAKAERRPYKTKITSATIVSAIFADGEFRGRDKAPIRHDVEITFQLMREAWRLAQAKEWDKLQVMAEKVDDGGQSAALAQQLLAARGNDAAMAALSFLGTLPASTWTSGAAMLRGIPTVMD
jgi:hypothetical protein